ncbi:MAG: helix-turn-helix domain-containing protein [Pseudomonadota bacterium]
MPPQLLRRLEREAQLTGSSPAELLIKTLDEALQGSSRQNLIDSEQNLLTPKQAAAMLNRSVSTLAKMRCSGEGPTFVKLGRRSVGYRREDLARYIEDRLRGNTSMDACGYR